MEGEQQQQGLALHSIPPGQVTVRHLDIGHYGRHTTIIVKSLQHYTVSQEKSNLDILVKSIVLSEPI